MSTIVPMTAAGYQALQDELKQLKKVERPKVVEDIATARDHGDLKENAEYHAARERQSFLEGRIQDLESKLANVQVIDISQLKNDGKVVFGSIVTLLNLDNDKKMVYQIVGDDEADIRKNKISYAAPIARALIGKFEGDEVDVEAPSGVIAYEILKVAYVES
jgi:transcription elongation factor GreA